MSLVIDLLILAILIPGLALLGHLFVAYYLAPKRARESILDALVNNIDFKNELMKSLLNALFTSVQDGEKTVIPIDTIIERAKQTFAHWFDSSVKERLPDLELPVQSVNEYGEPAQDPLAAVASAVLPKNVKKWIPVLELLLRNR